MHTFMTTPLIKKLNIWGLGFLCPLCSGTCAPREKYQALVVWSLPSVWVASCSSEEAHTDNHIPFQTSNARRNNTLRRRIRRGANKLAPPFKVGPATYLKLAPIGRTWIFNFLIEGVVSQSDAHLHDWMPKATQTLFTG